jgi:hypothetical protein
VSFELVDEISRPPDQVFREHMGGAKPPNDLSSNGLDGLTGRANHESTRSAAIQPDGERILPIARSAGG